MYQIGSLSVTIPNEGRIKLQLKMLVRRRNTYSKTFSFVIEDLMTLKERNLSQNIPRERPLNNYLSVSPYVEKTENNNVLHTRSLTIQAPKIRFHFPLS